MEGEYKCSKCGEFTVTCYEDWGVPGTSYDEIMYHIYFCSNCRSELSIPASEDENAPGDTIDF